MSLKGKNKAALIGFNLNIIMQIKPLSLVLCVYCFSISFMYQYRKATNCLEMQNCKTWKIIFNQ